MTSSGDQFGADERRDARRARAAEGARGAHAPRMPRPRHLDGGSSVDAGSQQDADARDEPARAEDPEHGRPTEEVAGDCLATWTQAERDWWWMGPFPGQVPGLVRRVRRILDVSQRGLAALLGVSQSVVARWETGRTSPRVSVLQRMLSLAGLAAQVHDAETGEQVEPMRADGARTRAGSRFPAHVDLRATGWWVPRRLRTMTSIEWWGWRQRSRDRRDPAIGYHLSRHRKWRDRSVHGTPDDHPALHQMVAEVIHLDERRDDRRRAARERPHPAS